MEQQNETIEYLKSIKSDISYYGGSDVMYYECASAIAILSKIPMPKNGTSSFKHVIDILNNGISDELKRSTPVLRRIKSYTISVDLLRAYRF